MGDRPVEYPVTLESSPAKFRIFPFVLASTVSAALILAAPFLGEIRRAILLRFPGQFVSIVGAVVLLVVVSAIVTALIRVHQQDRRDWRYAALATSGMVAVGYAYLTRTPDPQVNAVERFHFVEYGLVTFLFYRAWRPAGDLSTIALPVLAGLLVGTMEEWFQWFIPARVGDVRDVFLNGVAICCGLLFSVALAPLANFSVGFSPAGLRRIGVFAALLVLAFAGFFQSVHIGHLVSGDGWSFRSAYTGARLDQLAADRAERWRSRYLDRPKRLSPEDQYATEGLWHVQRRNTAWAAGDFVSARQENQILERYFVPVLDTPSYISKTGHRWTVEHRTDAERRFTDLRSTVRYESHAHPSAIFVWPSTLYWTIVSVLALLLALPWALHRVRFARVPAVVQPQ